MEVIYLPNYDIVYLGKKAEELGFVRDTLEKVTRLADTLEYLNTNPILKNSLALKGGTAINLTIFNLPRLSVDIDLDYLITNSREEMLESRNLIHVPRIPPPLNYLARINESEGGGMNRFMSVYNTFARV